MPNHRLLLADAVVVRDLPSARFAEQAPKSILRRFLVAANLAPLARDLPGASSSPVAPDDVPHADQQRGNLFAGPGKVAWYLPTIVPVDDPDPVFGFAASRTTEIDQATGEPFCTCRLTLALRKAIPADAADFRNANPDRTLKEVALADLEAAVIIRSMKDGVLQEVTTRATLEPTNGDTLSLRAEGILGVNVIALYQNLVAGGCASVVVSGTYRTWRPQALPPVVGGAAAPAFEVGVAPFSVTLELERKYEADAYRPRYTISGSDGQLRVIVNADDLHHFDLPQTEFIELRALGDVQARYPSISKLYLGVISRTVIVIPAHYVILRESAVCAATCNALVDSSPGVNAGCKFDFTFTLVPDVSSIDLALLINEINTRQEPELRGLQFHLPKRFNTTSNGSQFPNVFLSSTRFSNGANDPYSLTLSALIVEQAAGTPAVANANMFIAQLRSTSEPFLTGTVSIVLDDVYQGSVTSALMLNFKNTQASGNAGLSFSVEEANKQVVLQNDSAFSLQVDRVAFLTSDGTAVLPVAQVVPPAGSVSVESQAMRPDVQLLSDCEVAVGQTISRSELFKLLQFRTIDVQNTQFMFSINATDVNFAGRGINDIGVRVTLADAPAVSIPPMQVLQDRRFDSTRVVLPLLTAIGELKATVALVVTFTNASSPPKSFAVEHDFSQYPIFSLRDADVPA